MDIATQIRDYLSQRYSLSAKGISLTGNTLLLEEGIVDSIGILDLVLFVETTFGIQTPEVDIVPENFDTINKLAAYVNQQRMYEEE